MKNGQAAILRSGVASDGQAALEVFNLTHEETDFLLSYPDESSMDAEQESEFLERKQQVQMRWKSLRWWEIRW